MRTLKGIILVILLVAAAVPASAGIKDYKVGMPLELRTQAVGAYDLHHGHWMGGWSVDVLWLHRRDEDKPIVYLAVNNMYDLNERGKGSLGAAIGINTGKAGETIGKAMGLIAPDQVKRTKWLRDIANWVSFEVGGGRRVAGVPKGSSPWYYSVGGKIKIPLADLWYGIQGK